MMTKKRTDFLAMWCSEGLECVVDLSQWKNEHDVWEKSKMWSVLRDDRMHDVEPKIPLQMMILRAKFNTHRCYEIYTFTATPGISKQDVEDLFKSNPQHIVDFIRKNGQKVYSDYRGEEKKVIR